MRPSIDARNNKPIKVYGADSAMICVQNHKVSSVLLSNSCFNKGDEEFEKSLKIALNTLIRDNIDELTLLCEDILTDSECITFIESVINERITQIQKIFE